GKDASRTPSPVILVFPPLGDSGSLFAVNTMFPWLWPEATVVYAQGLPDLYNGQVYLRWQLDPGEHQDRDLHYVDALLEALPSILNVDDRRIYATGFSFGASFTDLLIATRAERFAAFALVDGCLRPEWSPQSPPRPVMVVGDTIDGCNNASPNASQ